MASRSIKCRSGRFIAGGLEGEGGPQVRGDEGMGLVGFCRDLRQKKGGDVEGMIGDLDHSRLPFAVNAAIFMMSLFFFFGGRSTPYSSLLIFS